MKIGICLIISFLALLVACEESLEESFDCNDTICSEYFTIWKSLFADMNNLSKEFVEEHTHMQDVKVVKWKQGESLNVDYDLNLDWCTIHLTDRMIILIDPENELYPSFNGNRGNYLNESEIQIAVDQNYFQSNISKFNAMGNLQYLSEQDALVYLSNYIRGNFDFLSYDLNKAGNPTLYARYSKLDGGCTFASLDLFSTEVESFDGACDRN